MAKAGDGLLNPVTGLRTVFRKTARETSGEGVDKPAPKAEKEGVKAEGVATVESGKKVEASDDAGAQAAASEEAAGKSDAADPTGAQVVAAPKEGDGPEDEPSGGGEPGGPEGKAAKGE